MSQLSDTLKKYEKLVFLADLGWTRDSLSLFKNEKEVDYRIGSPIFNLFFKDALRNYPPKKLLTILMDMVQMPLELTGDIHQTQSLLKAFHPSLAPDSFFWGELASLVNATFPGKSLGKQGDLEQRLHQFRYLISSQQAQYVRIHFRKKGMTDSQALTHYLKDKRGPFFWRKDVDYSFRESARLHNKLKLENDQVIFPNNDVSYNIKLLMGFHTEFIIDSFGHFLNELDAEEITERGIVNGASFNYGTSGQRHWDLDVTPIQRHDPKFRGQVSHGYRSPKLIAKKWFKQQVEDFDLSYFNRKGYFGRKGRSGYSHVKWHTNAYKWKIRAMKMKALRKEKKDVI